MQSSGSIFVFKGYKSDFSQGKVDFYYEIRKNRKTLQFTETLCFKKPGKEFKNIPPELIQRALNDLLLILGISYWKTFCSKKMEILPFTLSKKEAKFWNTVYTKGLGEFFYKNNINFCGLVQFPYSRNRIRTLVKSNTRIVKNRALLLFGGGKDSLVSAELLKKRKKEFVLFRVGESSVQKKTAAIVARPSFVFTRTIDAKLFALNNKKGIYNGHVPASALYAFLGIFAAMLYNFRDIIASNEKSANYGNVRYLGTMVNHQWSKSQEFEALLKSYLKQFVTPNIRYYSLLRPLSELEIVKRFALYPQYFRAFSSCNRNFSITKKPKKKWCGKCPKCAFVFAALAAYLPKEEVIQIFGKNLFADEKLVPLYEELLGFQKFKPFECVGTPEETRKAFQVIQKSGEYNQTPVMRMFESSKIL